MTEEPANNPTGDSESVDRPDGTTLTHVDERGDAQMVDVGDKPDSNRRAVARGTIDLQSSTIAAVRGDDVEKGDVLTTARIGAIQAVKRTPESIPLCHSIPVTNVDVDFAVSDAAITLTVAVETTGKTGCEMEALEGVTTGLNVVWDMVKAAEKDDSGQYPTAKIRDVQVLAKEKHPADQ